MKAIYPSLSISKPDSSVGHKPLLNSRREGRSGLIGLLFLQEFRGK